MGFLENIKKKVIEKKAELDERRRFQQLVEEKSKPIRRSAYMQQMMKEAVQEGIAKAKLDAKARLPKEKPHESEFGINTQLEDPFKFINKKEVKKDGNIQKKANNSSSSS